jgi:hypothetical protein
MNKKLLTALACAAWVGVLVSTAAPASAVAVTMGSGAYATCSNSSTPQLHDICGFELSYDQNIRLMNESCSKGSCVPDYGGIYTEWTYPVGRHVAELLSTCDSYNVYGLDTCAC